jgi:hypothetical protein
MAFDSVLRQCGLVAIAATLTAVLSSGAGLAQTPNAGAQPPAGATAPAVKKTHPAKKRAGKAKAAVEPVPVVEPPKPIEPVIPNWPVNAQAEVASVGWDGRQLSVAATNSSLHQILRDITTATGVKVDGLGGDQRVFGRYGPASARDVLGQLLEGSGYNVMMVGDQGQGTPRQVVLSSKVSAPVVAAPGSAQPAPAADDDQPEEPEQPEQPVNPIMNRPMAVPPQQQQPPGGRTPQQQMQEMQLRQQQLQNQQQQQAQPPN